MNHKTTHKANQSWPARVLKLRNKLGLSQRELAKVMGVTPGAVAHWETGLRQLSGPVEKLIEILEISATPHEKIEQHIWQKK